jgi:hypothetical protein
MIFHPLVTGRRVHWSGETWALTTPFLCMAAFPRFIPPTPCPGADQKVRHLRPATWHAGEKGQKSPTSPMNIKARNLIWPPPTDARRPPKYT